MIQNNILPGVGSWIKALQNDPLEIFRAVADAEKCTNFLLSFELQQERIQTNGQVLNLNMIIRRF